jgi:hypothetical protein
LAELLGREWPFSGRLTNPPFVVAWIGFLRNNADAAVIQAGAGCRLSSRKRQGATIWKFDVSPNK